MAAGTEHDDAPYAAVAELFVATGKKNCVGPCLTWEVDGPPMSVPTLALGVGVSGVTEGAAGICFLPVSKVEATKEKIIVSAKTNLLYSQP